MKISLIHIHHFGSDLEQLLSSFARHNTFYPVEWIILDRTGSEQTAETVSRFASKAVMRIISVQADEPAAACLNKGVRSAVSPLVCLLNSHVVFNSDILPSAYSILEQQTHDMTGLELDDACAEPETPRLSAHFGGLLCRKADVLNAGGIDESRKPGHELDALVSVIARRLSRTYWPYSVSEHDLLRRIKEYNRQKPLRKARVAVYTAITGGYDPLIHPETIVNEWDYVLFSDTPVSGEHIFEVRKPDYQHCDPTRTARYIKTHPHELLPEYDCSIWVDSNILIRGSHLVRSVQQFLNSSSQLMLRPHPERHCLYQEYEACLELGKDDPLVMNRQVERCRAEGMPSFFGLFETNILVRKHSSEQIKTMGNFWWEEMEKGSRRDQLALPYVLWQLDLSYAALSGTRSFRKHRKNNYCLFLHGGESDLKIPPYGPPSFSEPVKPQKPPEADRDQTLKPYRDQEVDIIVCVHNALEHVRPCLESVYRHLEESHRLIVIDDASDHPTSVFLDEFMSGSSQAVLLRNEIRQGYTASANQGLKASTAGFVILLNSDTLVCADWAVRMLHAARTTDKAGIVGPWSNAASWQSLPRAVDPTTGALAVNDLPKGVGLEEMDRLCRELGWSGSFPQIPLVNGFCYGITRELIDCVGLLDQETFPSGYGEEDDYSLRSLNAGFTNIIAAHCFVYHAKSKSFGSEARMKLARQGKNALYARYGKETVDQAVLAARANPQLQKIRSRINVACAFAGYGKKNEQEGGSVSPGPGSWSSPPAGAGTFAESSFFKFLSRLMEQTASPELMLRLLQSRGAHHGNLRLVDRLDSPPLISVIMPTHNRAAIIGWAINSVLEQHYPNWELLVCDDASTDNTAAIIRSIRDPRIKYMKLSKRGAAAARNAGLKEAKGEIIAYLDSDNIWHPGYLTAMAAALLENPGRSSAFADFIDYLVQNDDLTLLSHERPEFNHEKLLGRNYIDLNSFAHRRELYDLFGGFNEALSRRQDYDLILKYTWLRDPVHVRVPLCLYQRNKKLDQITYSRAEDHSCVNIIDSAVDGYLSSGLKSGKPKVNKVTIISWDMCRNHFSKPFALAEALSTEYRVQLISFRFFEEKIFQPLQNVKPNFETVYLPGSDFPGFFSSMDKALELINGEVIYVVKPRLPSLGLALLANFHRKIPVVLEINDLETVVASPGSGQTHSQLGLDSIDSRTTELGTPYSDLWSQIMDPLAAELPVLVTHNKNIDSHFREKCLYMRNIKDESVYDPDQYNREQIRSELGFAPDDRIILFGGLLRRHKGINELVELVRRLDNPRYKLLFVGSRPNPDQESLIRQHGSRVKVLPPQDRPAMARINLAADLVILWLNPDISASHYQMPYKATDAFAMKTPVIANDISDLGDLGRQGYLRLVPFGDWPAMIQTIQDIFSNESSTQKQVEAARRLYLRQFSYAAARANMSLILNRVDKEQPVYHVSKAFAEKFQEFRNRVVSDQPGKSANSTGKDQPGPSPRSPLEESLRDQHIPPVIEPDPIRLIDVTDPAAAGLPVHQDICVIMPCIDPDKGMKTAEILYRRAGTECTILVVNDTLRQGFIKTLNQTAADLSVKYVVYTAQDAYPSRNWLQCARSALEKSGKNLLAFNDGKWEGRIASFGMVRTDWARQLYSGNIFYPEYVSHKADNELTVLARALDTQVYAPECVLMEYDPDKDSGGSNPRDTALFKKRFTQGFTGLAPVKNLKALAPEYNVDPASISLSPANE